MCEPGCTIVANIYMLWLKGMHPPTTTQVARPHPTPCCPALMTFLLPSFSSIPHYIPALLPGLPPSSAPLPLQCPSHPKQASLHSSTPTRPHPTLIPGPHSLPPSSRMECVSLTHDVKEQCWWVKSRPHPLHDSLGGHDEILCLREGDKLKQLQPNLT